MRRPTSRPTAVTRNTPKPALSWTYYLAAAVACTVLVAGFFLAARQHFSSVDFGIKNSRLRRQLDELQSEKRRLLLTKEVTMSPGEVRKAAKRVGFVDAPQAQLASFTGSSPASGKMTAKAVETVQTRDKAPTAKVVRTVMSEPSNRPLRQDGQAKVETTRDRKDRT